MEGSTKNRGVIQTSWSFHTKIGELSSNLWPSRSKAPRVIDPPSRLGFHQVHKNTRGGIPSSISQGITQSFNEVLGFGME
jgi:hypothetical protein